MNSSKAAQDVVEKRDHSPGCDHLLACGHYERYTSYSFEIHQPCIAGIEEGQAVKVYWAAMPHYCLSASQTDNGVVLAPEDDSDLHQHWIKDDAWAKLVKDETQSPAFALINRGSLKALKHHGSTQNARVELSIYKIDESLLWTLSGDVGNGFRCIRPASNICVNLTQAGQDGDKFILFRFNNTDNQKWKISPLSTTPRLSSPVEKMKSNSVQLTRKLSPTPGQTVCLCCEANSDFFLTSRKDEVILARRDDCDFHQQWVKDSRGDTYKDNAGFPAFVLVNKATSKALMPGNSEWDRVKLSPYNADNISQAILWTESADAGQGFRYIRPLRSPHLNLDAIQADKKSKGIRDGNEVIVFRLNRQKNQRWKMTPTPPPAIE